MVANTGTVTLKAASVNSGTAVDLNASSVMYAWNNNVRIDPISSSYDITEAEHRGWENPSFTINGTINSEAGSDEVTEILLKEFAKIKNEQVTLKVIYGTTGSEKTFTNSAGSTTTGVETGVGVIIENFNIDISPRSVLNAHLLNFTLQVREDKI